MTAIELSPICTLRVMNIDSRPNRFSFRYRFLTVVLRRMGLVVLLVMGAALSSGAALAQQARVAALAPEALPVAARIDLLPADLHEEPLRRSLRRILSRASGRQEAAYKTGAGAGQPARIMAGPMVETQLIADDGAEGYQCGFSVSMDGDHALVGAFGDDTNGLYAGSAYIFSLNGEAWQQEAKLLPDDGEQFDFFGWSVALSGKRALVGAFGDDAETGAAYVFEFNGSTWQQTAKLTASGGAMFDDFGISVALDGDRALVGAFGVADNGAYSGAAYVFEFNGSTWQQTAKLTANDALEGDNLGVSVALNGDQALVGADGVDDNGPGSGAAYLFSFNGSSWQQGDKITAPDGADYDFFGNAVSLGSDRMLVGAPLDDDNGSGSGSAYLFVYDGSDWKPDTKLTASDGVDFDDFGASVSLDGDHAFIGAVGVDDNGNSSGGAYIFAQNGSGWTEETKLTASNAAADHFFGSVSMSGGRFLVGAAGADNATGAAYCYEAEQSNNSPADDAVVFATNSAWLRWGSDILSGSVLVNDVSNGPKLNAGAELSIGFGATTPAGADVKAPRIWVKFGAVVDSDVYYLKLANNGTINGTLNTPHPFPLLQPDDFPPFNQAPAGRRDVVVPRNGSVTLPPGDYRDIVVRRGGELLFTGGIYNVRSIDARDRAKLLFGGASEVRVERRFDTDWRVYVGPAGGSGIAASDLIFYIAGINGRNGRLWAHPQAAQIGLNNTVAANFYVPKGTLWLGAGTEATGAFWGRDVVVGIATQLKLDSFWASGGTALASLKAEETKGLNEFETASSLEVPEAYQLAANYPNPFNPTTTITFALPEAAPVRLTVYDVTGRAVAHLIDETRAAGWHEVRFDASGLPSGVYLYHIVAGSFTQTRRMVLVK